MDDATCPAMKPGSAIYRDLVNPESESIEFTIQNVMSRDFRFDDDNCAASALSIVHEFMDGKTPPTPAWIAANYPHYFVWLAAHGFAGFQDRTDLIIEGRTLTIEKGVRA